MAWNILDDKINWANITSVPSDLADGKIDWTEVQNKPLTFPATPVAGIEMAENNVNLIDFHTQGIGLPSTDFDARIFVGQARTSANNASADMSYQAQNHLFIGGVLMISIPSSSIGLAAGSIWRDANGFLRIV